MPRRKLGAQTGSMMLMMLALSGAAGRPKRAINPNNMLRIYAVGSVCGCKTPLLVAPAMHDKHAKGFEEMPRQSRINFAWCSVVDVFCP